MTFSDNRSGENNLKPLKVFIFVFLLIAGANKLPAQKSNEPVVLADDGKNFTLTNGTVSAKIEEQSGALVSLKYKGLEMLGAGQGRSNGYWSLPGTSLNFGSKRTASVVQDPSKNNGEEPSFPANFFMTEAIKALRLMSIFAIRSDAEIRDFICRLIGNTSLNTRKFHFPSVVSRRSSMTTFSIG